MLFYKRRRSVRSTKQMRLGPGLPAVRARELSGADGLACVRACEPTNYHLRCQATGLVRKRFLLFAVPAEIQTPGRDFGSEASSPVRSVRGASSSRGFYGATAPGSLLGCRVGIPFFPVRSFDPPAGCK
jgi:hypothetical protein